MVGVVTRRAVSTEAGRWLFWLALGVYFFTAGGSLTTTDAVVAFDVTRNIVEHGTVATSGNLLGMDAFRGADGRYYSPFGLLQSVYNIPFYVAGTSFVEVSGITAGRPDSIPKAFVALGQVLVSSWIVWQIFWLCLFVTKDEQAAALAALTAGFGSVLWPYAKFGFNQPLACATLTAAVISVFIGARRNNWRPTAMGGVWLAASLMTRHEMAIAALPIGMWLLFQRRTVGQASVNLRPSRRVCSAASRRGWRSTSIASATRSTPGTCGTPRRSLEHRSFVGSQACSSVQAHRCFSTRPWRSSASSDS